MKKPGRTKSYEATEHGIVVKDKRQMTNGPITPNYVIDLYLPIIGFEGLGVLTSLYRVAINDVRAIAKLTEYARAGRVGFRTLDALLSLLDECKIISVRKPKGADKGRHMKTEIELLDPPSAVPEKYTKLVLELTLTRWMIEEASCQVTIGQLPSDNWPVVRQQLADCQPATGQLSGDNFMNKEDVPIWDVPIEDVPTHMVTAPGGAGVCDEASGGKSSRHDFDTVLSWARSLPDVTNPDGLATARHKDGRADSLIDRWLEGQAKPSAALPGAPDGELLARLLAAVKARVNPESYRAWFEPIAECSRDAQTIYVRAPDQSYKDWITTNYFDVLEEALAELGLCECKIEFICGR